MADGRNYGYFWTDDNGDRIYKASDMNDFLHPFFTEGVFNGDLQVVANDNMTVTVNTGWIKIGTNVRQFFEPVNISVGAASGTYPRKDIVVVRRDTSSRDITIEYIKGTAASTPTPPALTRQDPIYEMQLCVINVPAGASRITQANIQDTRMNSDVCGWVAATVEEINFNQIKAQFDQWQIEEEADFNAWYETIKNKIAQTDVVRLQTEIDETNVKVNNLIPRFTCSTAAGTTAKATSSLSGYTLATGNKVIVRFTNTNTATTPTLNVAGTGAKTIRYQNIALPYPSMLMGGTEQMFVYDGTYWQLVEWDGVERISDKFSTATTYSAGDLTIYNNQLYRFNKTHLGTWATADADKTTVGNEIEQINSNLSALAWLNEPYKSLASNIKFGNYSGAIDLKTYLQSKGLSVEDTHEIRLLVKVGEARQYYVFSINKNDNVTLTATVGSYLGGDYNVCGRIQFNPSTCVFTPQEAYLNAQATTISAGKCEITAWYR